jgi:hypothetical protein
LILPSGKKWKVGRKTLVKPCQILWNCELLTATIQPSWCRSYCRKVCSSSSFTDANIAIYCNNLL